MTPKIVLLALTLSTGAAAAPAAAQMRAPLDGSMTSIPPGVMRTISFAADGHPIVVDRPYTGETDIQPVQIVTIQTTEEDEDGNPISTKIETRLEPLTAFAYAPQGPQMTYMPPQAAEPIPAPHGDGEMLANFLPPVRGIDAEALAGSDSLPLEQTALDIPAPDFGPEEPASAPVELAQQTPMRAGDFDMFIIPALLRSGPAVVPTQAAQRISSAGLAPAPPAALASGSAHPLAIRRDPRTGHFIAPIRINGVVIQAIVDTGAQDTILSAQDARATGAARDIVRSEPMAGIGGYTMLSVAKLRSMEVAGQNLGSFTAAIGQEGIPYTLLGQTEINRLGRIVIEGGVMTITPRAAQVALR
jgi:clan AA aspartic protease (TIGR02281 family)